MDFVIKIENDFSWLKTTDEHVKADLWSKLRFREKGYFHSRLYKQKIWDGFKDFFNKDSGKFLTGLLPEIQAYLRHHSIQYTVEDSRNPVKWAYSNIDVHFLDKWLPIFNKRSPKSEHKKNFVLRDFQPEFVNSVIKNGRGIITAPTACHGKGQLVIMHDGSMKKVEDIRIGDALLGPNSLPRTVLKIHCGQDQLYKVMPLRGLPFTVNSKHILTLVKIASHKYRYPGERTDKIIDVSVEDYLKWKKWPKHIHKLFKVGVDFPEKILPLEPYFLGVLLGDGGLPNTPNVTTIDEEIVTEIKKQANFFKLKIRNSKKITYYLSSRTGKKKSNPIKEILKCLKLNKSTCDNKFIPFIYKTGSKIQRLELLAGLLDTDGHLSGHTYDYISKSEQLANDVSYVCNSLGLHSTVNSCEKSSQNGTKGTYFRVYISGDIKQIPVRIKYKKAINKIKTNSQRCGFSIEPIGFGDYYGFTLHEGPHYLLPDFFVTHNSGKTLCMTCIIHALPVGTPTLILANRKSLCDQNYSELNWWGVEQLGRLYEGYNEPNVVTVATWQSVHKIQTLLPKFKVLIVDEIHEMMSKGPRKIYSKMTQASVRVGVSATPFKFGGSDKTQKYSVKGFFGPILKVESAGEGGVLTTAKLQKRKMLSGSKCIFYPITSPQLPHAIFSDAITLGLAENWEFHRLVARLANGLKGRTLILVDRIAHGDNLESLLPGCLWIRGQDNIETRKYVVNQLKVAKDNVIAIATQGIFNTGISVWAHNLLNAAGGKADHQIIQRIGRGLRVADDKEILNYYDFLFLINEYLEDHSKKRIKILKKEGHEVIIKDSIDF